MKGFIPIEPLLRAQDNQKIASIAHELFRADSASGTYVPLAHLFLLPLVIEMLQILMLTIKIHYNKFI